MGVDVDTGNLIGHYLNVILRTKYRVWKIFDAKWRELMWLFLAELRTDKQK